MKIRRAWKIKPITKVKPSKKLYNRKKNKKLDTFDIDIKGR